MVTELVSTRWLADRASVNKVAVTTLKVAYPSLLDVGCFSHTFDNEWGKFVIATL